MKRAQVLNICQQNPNFMQLGVFRIPLKKNVTTCKDHQKSSSIKHMSTKCLFQYNSYLTPSLHR
jgi:hypothetical protein